MLVCPHPPISAGKSNIGTKPAFKEIGREENKEKAKKKKKWGWVEFGKEDLIKD